MLIISILVLFAEACITPTLNSDLTNWKNDQPDQWEYISTRKINTKNEQDEIVVKQKAIKYQSIKLEMIHGSINLWQVTMIFKDDTKQIVEIRKTIKDGTSKEIKIDSDHGPLKKIIYNYDTRGVDANKAKIKLYGSR